MDIQLCCFSGEMVCIRVVTKLELVRKKTLLEINYEKNVVLDLLKEVSGEFMA